MSRPHPDDARIETTYDYVDETGELLYQGVRLRNPKDFRQRHPDGAGGWTWNLQGVRRVLYRLPAVLAAATEGRGVWIAEGEKDVDALEALKFTATCNPMGAGKWRDEFSTCLKGVAFALILPDCDEPGRKAAHEIAAALHTLGIRVKVIDLAADRADGYDVSDFILEYGDEEAGRRLRELARTVNEWKPGAASAQGKPVLHVVRAAAFCRDTPEIDTDGDLLGPLLRRGQRVHPAGPTGEGKSTLAFQMLHAAVSGEQFLKWRGRNGGTRAIVIDLEQSAETLRKRLEDAGLADREDVDVVHMPEGLTIDKDRAQRQALEDAIAGHDIALIDPFYQLHGGEGASEDVIRAVVSTLDGIRRRTGACLLINSHTRKPQPGAQLRIEDIFGSSLVTRNAEIVVGIQIVKEGRSVLHWWKDRDGRLEVPAKGTWTLAYHADRGFHFADDNPDQLEIPEAA